MKTLALVRAVPGDVPSLAALEREAFGPDCYSIWAVATFCSHGACYFVRDGGEVVGHVFLSACWSAPEEAYLASFAVTPALRGRGIGGRALALLLEALREQSFRSLTLTVDPDNEIALRLYERAAFRRKERVSDCYGPGKDRIVMHVAL